MAQEPSKDVISKPQAEPVVAPKLPVANTVSLQGVKPNTEDKSLKGMVINHN
jgi:hypothetical protein